MIVHTLHIFVKCLNLFWSMHGGYLSEYRIKADRVAVKINPVQSTRNLPAIFKIRNIIVGFDSPFEMYAVLLNWTLT